MKWWCLQGEAVAQGPVVRRQQRDLNPGPLTLSCHRQAHYPTELLPTQFMSLIRLANFQLCWSVMSNFCALMLFIAGFHHRFTVYEVTLGLCVCVVAAVICLRF